MKKEKKIRRSAGSNIKKRSIRKGELFELVADKMFISKRLVRVFVETLRDIAFSELKRTGTFTLPDLGKFLLQERKPRVGRNPRTGEIMKIPARMVLKFRVAKAARDNCLGG